MDSFDGISEHSTVVHVKPNNKDMLLMNENNPEEQLNPFAVNKTDHQS
jgi:hypothetical protein